MAPMARPFLRLSVARPCPSTHGGNTTWRVAPWRTEAHLAHGEMGLRTVALGDDDTLESLQALLVTFLDLYLYAHGITRPKGGNVGAFGFLKQFIYDWVRHVRLPSLDFFSRNLGEIGRA